MQVLHTGLIDPRNEENYIFFIGMAEFHKIVATSTGHFLEGVES
jgi:hypothetical protein